MAEETASSDAVTKNQLDTELSISGGLMTGNLDMNNNRIYNVAQPDGHNQPATKMWSENKFLDKSSGVMAGSLYIYIYIYRFAELDYLVQDIYCYSEFHAPCGAIIRQLPKITDTYGDVQNLKIQNNV